MLSETSLFGIPVIALFNEYGQIGLLICVLAQLISVVIGRLFNRLTFQRETVSLTCAFACSSSAAYMTQSHILSFVFFVFAFSLVYLYTNFSDAYN